jgi:hypothetical protein
MRGWLWLVGSAAEAYDMIPAVCVLPIADADNGWSVAGAGSQSWVFKKKKLTTKRLIFGMYSAIIFKTIYIYI